MHSLRVVTVLSDSPTDYTKMNGNLMHSLRVVTVLSYSSTDYTKTDGNLMHSLRVVTVLFCPIHRRITRRRMEA